MAYRIWTGGFCSALAEWFLTFSFSDSSSKMSSCNLPSRAISTWFVASRVATSASAQTAAPVRSPAQLPPHYE
eukprot:1381392-Rhodomonas_salina.1